MPDPGWNSTHFLIGLTGGIGSGKSCAARIFSNLGAVVLDADQLAHTVLTWPESIKRLSELFGLEVRSSDGQVDRAKIASLVFEDPEKLQQLNAVVHPGVRKLYEQAVADSKPGTILVYDVPLLFEANLQQNFDQTLVISAPTALRQKRVTERNGWTAEQFEARNSRQMPLTQKEKLADLIIENTGTPSELRRAIQQYYKAVLTARPTGKQNA